MGKLDLPLDFPRGSVTGSRHESVTFSISVGPVVLVVLLPEPDDATSNKISDSTAVSHFFMMSLPSILILDFPTGIAALKNYGKMKIAISKRTAKFVTSRRRLQTDRRINHNSATRKQGNSRYVLVGLHAAACAGALAKSSSSGRRRPTRMPPWCRSYSRMSMYSPLPWRSFGQVGLLKIRRRL